MALDSNSNGGGRGSAPSTVPVIGPLIDTAKANKKTTIVVAVIIVIALIVLFG